MGIFLPPVFPCSPNFFTFPCHQLSDFFRAKGEEGRVGEVRGERRGEGKGCSSVGHVHLIRAGRKEGRGEG